MRLLKRHAGHDRRAAAWLRLDDEFTGDELQTLSHARQTETAILRHGFGIESASAVAHGQREGLRCALEVHRKTGSGAVPHRILQRLLQHSEQTERDVGPHGSGHVLVGEVDFDLLTGRDLRTEVP